MCIEILQRKFPPPLMTTVPQYCVPFVEELEDVNTFDTLFNLRDRMSTKLRRAYKQPCNIQNQEYLRSASSNDHG